MDWHKTVTITRRLLTPVKKHPRMSHGKALLNLLKVYKISTPQKESKEND